MTDSNTTAAPQDVLLLERRLAHPREKVFAAWTEPEQLVSWWGPEGIYVPDHVMDVRENGAWATTMRNDDGAEFHVSGVYLEISPPRRLVFTWAWISEGVRGHETTVTVDFAETGGGTQLTLTQQRFESSNARDLHGEGWSSSLNCLSDTLAA